MDTKRSSDEHEAATALEDLERARAEAEHEEACERGGAS